MLTTSKKLKNKDPETKTKELYFGFSWVSLFVHIRFWTGSFVQLEKLLPKKGQILDLGCGYGFFVNYIALCSKRRRVIGIEINKEKIRHADRRISNAIFKSGDATKIDLVKSNAIIMLDVLHHLDSYKKQEVLIKTCRKMLDKNGILLILEVDSKPLWKLILARITDFVLYSKEPIFYRYKKDMKKVLNKYFDKIKTRRVGKNPFPHLVYICYKN